MESSEKKFDIAKLYGEAGKALGAEEGMNFIDKIVDTGKFSVGENIVEIIKFFAEVPVESREELKKALFSLPNEGMIMQKFNSLKSKAGREDSTESIGTLVSKFKKHVEEVVITHSAKGQNESEDQPNEKKLKALEESERPGLDLIDGMMTKMNMLKECNVVPQHLENFIGALVLKNIRFGEAMENKFLAEVVPHIIKLIQKDNSVFLTLRINKIREIFASSFWPESIRNDAMLRLKKYE